MQNYFNQSNDLANVIRAYPDFITLVKNTLDSAKPTVQSFTGWTGPTHTFAIPMNDPELLFTTGDLKTAFGHVAITATLFAEVQKAGLVLSLLNIIGTAYKLYSFDVEMPWPASVAAQVQAGYLAAGQAGHVFEILVQLNAFDYTAVLPYNFE